MEKNTNYLKRTIEKGSVQSHYLGEERSYRVYLPPNFDRTQNYSIAYAQDGQDIFMFGRIATIANQLIMEKKIQPVIIVGVDVHKKQRTSEYAYEGKRNKAYRFFFSEELIPHIEKTYQHLNMEQDRLLIGDSLGGTVSLALLLDNPKTFTKCVSLSGAYFSSTQQHIKQHHDLSSLQLWMLIGTDETNVETPRGFFHFLNQNRRTKQLLEERNVAITYREEEGTHKWGFWQKYIPDALCYFFSKV